MANKILLLLLVAFTQVEAQQNNQLYWSQERKLTFADFQKFIPIDSSIGGVCASHIELSKPQLVDGKLTYRVYAIFEKLESGLAQQDTNALKHEQGHFDICEIGARKMRQYIYKSDVLSMKSTQEFSKKIKQFYKDETAMQQIYDDQTINGADSLQQKKWLDNIASKLDELKEFAN